MPRLQFPALELERCPRECIIHLQLPEWGPCLFEAVVFFMPGHQIEPTTTGFAIQFLPKRIMKMNQEKRHAMHLAAQYQCFTQWSQENVSVALLWTSPPSASQNCSIVYPCILLRNRSEKVPWQEGDLQDLPHTARCALDKSMCTMIIAENILSA